MNINISSILTSLLLSLILSGCFIFGEPTEFDETLGRTDAEIVRAAEVFSANKDWVRTIEYLEKAEKRFPNSRLAPQIKLNLAYAYKNFYRDEEALAMLDKFIRTYPNHPALDYAYYLKGVVLFVDRGIVDEITMQDISDRDVSQLEGAFQALKQMVRLFPESGYAEDAANRMTYLMNKISERELHVARYYMRREAYIGALNRAKYVLENYPQSVHQEEALVITISAYNKLGIKDLAADTKRVLDLNFPDTVFNKQKQTSDESAWWEFWDIID
jgi:outer membrane protein assembly factor BamD|tara:strand:- start:476 stop:1294 length:819 start_codon:yes stop_codon:yes gene_type:complete